MGGATGTLPACANYGQRGHCPSRGVTNYRQRGRCPSRVVANYGQRGRWQCRVVQIAGCVPAAPLRCKEGNGGIFTNECQNEEELYELYGMAMNSWYTKHIFNQGASNGNNMEHSS